MPHRPLLPSLLCLATPLFAGFQGPEPPRSGPDGPAATTRPAPPAALPAPGALPADASPRALELFEALIGPQREQEPIRAFDLSFWMRHRSAEGRQQNDVDARYRFLMPGFVRVELQSGRELLRGPRGDYLIDKGEVVPLTARVHVEDRQQLAEAVAIARNFLSLTDPARLRVVRLVARETAPHGLPGEWSERAAQLQWLEITSPDFHLAPRGGAPAPTPSADPVAPRLYRVSLGLSAVDRRPQLVVIHEEVAGAPTLSPASMLVELRQHGELDGFRLPRRVHVHEVDLSRSPWEFSARATSELALKPKPTTIGLRPTLTPENFVP